MQVSNQKPVELSPVYTPKITGAYDPTEYIKQTMAEPLFTPMVPTSPVSITINNQSITADDITIDILDCCGDTIDVKAEDKIKELFGQTVMNFDRQTPLSIQDTFAIQSAVKAQLPYPSPTCIYTPSSDIIPVCKDFINGTTDYDALFASFAFYTRAQTLGFYFINDTSFDDFKAFVATNTQPMAQLLPPQTLNNLNDFQKLTLTGLTESILIRNKGTDNNDEYSFARLIVALLLQYTTQISPTLFGCMPFSVNELFLPRSLVFININKHAMASAKQINDEWKMIAASLTNMRPKIINNNKLQKLTTATRTLQHIQANAITMKQHVDLQKAAKFKFRKTKPTSVDITKAVAKTIKKLGYVNRSENVFKASKKTYAKPNRRDPDNYDKMGVTTSTKYLPDIHIYLDTSGSISERNYQDAIKSCIMLAKKLDVNLYFNSFSGVLSPCTKLHTKGKNTNQIYNTFAKVPKVTGSTDFEQIWHYINASPKRRREFSLMITDFGYTARNHFVQHPKNLYYAPCSNMNWDIIVSDTEFFCKSMLKNDPQIRKHILF